MNTQLCNSRLSATSLNPSNEYDTKTIKASFIDVKLTPKRFSKGRYAIEQNHTNNSSNYNRQIED